MKLFTIILLHVGRTECLTTTFRKRAALTSSLTEYIEKPFCIFWDYTHFFIENPLNARAFRDIRAQVMFLKLSKSLKNITSDHMSLNTRASYDFLPIIFSTKLQKLHACMDTQLCNGFQNPNCSYVLFYPISYNLVTGKPSVTFFRKTLWND